MMLAIVLQGTTSVLAGTTGAITGNVVDPSTSKPISGARVGAVSPSQSSSTTTDASGHFSFVSLVPDTYTIAIAATSTHDAASVSGVTVQADQTISVSVSQPQKLKVIGAVTSRAAGALVAPGTTADVYSINAVTQDKAAAIGGGGNLNSAWSAISTVPGVYVANSQNGYIGAAPAISIRGGNYDQIGYELDGVPVNRSFDNYPSGPASSLGQQELQVYTGAPSATAEANGLSGYINQVIRTGTAPASRNLMLAVGAPAFYNKLAFEAGGANPARTFSYYLGAGAYNQDFRQYDEFNGASLQQLWGAPLAPCNGVSAAYATPRGAPGCFGPQGQDYTNPAPGGAPLSGPTQAWVNGPFNAFTAFVPRVQDRDTVLNLHVGIPRKDGNRDDVQLLFDNNFIVNRIPNSTNDQGGAAFLFNIGALPGFCNAVQAPCYNDGYRFVAAPNGAALPPAFAGGNGAAVQWLFPDSPGGRAFRGAIAPDKRDAFVNDQSIVKLQYQRNFGTSAFLRVYGYTYYSDWLQNGPQSTLQNNLGIPSQYLLDSHTRGLSAQFSDQLNAQHLLTLQGSYTTATTMRYNNSGIGFSGNVGWLVDSTNPYSGVCYDGTAGPANSGPCGFSTFVPQTFTARQAYLGTVTPASTFGTTCGGHACAYLVGENGNRATFNTVVPRFTSASVADQWKPTDRINVSLGLRYDSFVFQGADTTNSPARTMWYNAYNLANGTNLVNVPNQVESYSVLQPRIGMTYTASPSTVLRLSYGRYAEAPNAAFQQYNFLQPNDVAALARFGRFGLPTTPAHPIPPEISSNYDFSFEHSFRGDTSLKLTPFVRKTQDQIQQFFLDQRTGFVSGLNVGKQTSRGFELEVDKGDFSRNGLAARLTFTYTNSYINYTRLGNGVSIVDQINGQLQGYNAYTSFCAGHAADPRCGPTLGGGTASPCYDQAGNAIGCGAGAVANPYWNAPVQPLLDPNANYPTFNTFPGGLPGGGGYTTFGAPYVASVIVQYKHGPLAVTPALQFAGGTRYGAPLTTPGVAPDQGCTSLGGSVTANDPRYPYGAAGGSPFDGYSGCGFAISIPNQFTNRFDGVGGFVAPSALLLHTQVTYEVNKRLTLVGNFANIINRCFGGTKVGFAVSQACGYSTPPAYGGGNTTIGNQFNPGNALQPQSFQPYTPFFPGFPFNMYVEARIKI
jgi:hypothetical protein